MTWFYVAFEDEINCSDGSSSSCAWAAGGFIPFTKLGKWAGKAFGRIFSKADEVAEVAFDGERLASDVRTRRANSGNTLKKTQNVAVGRADIDGTTFDLESVSGKKSPPGTVTMPEGTLFEPAAGDVVRPWYAERKLLEYVGARINKNLRGTVHLYTERTPCDACSSVIEQFQKRFPGVKVIVGYGTP
ncbi:deaminase domain-containing protein [Nonomuraea sp. MTCD27]|uniref:deaminase domain-containing protein n=1 Tax=Nonomuraea sp. MTCD27 TaxID=1676747 RepID=UPI0035C20CCD